MGKQSGRQTSPFCIVRPMYVLLGYFYHNFTQGSFFEKEKANLHDKFDMAVTFKQII